MAGCCADAADDAANTIDDIELAEGSGGPREANPLKRSDASVSTKGWRRRPNEGF
jgi:hypothetical protein